MKKTFLIFLVFSGCVYYNTFYNAEKYCEEGNYQKSLEKSEKILERYPDSKYVDDAIFIMGKSLYHLKKPGEAQKSFKKLIDVFPSSPFVDESYLFLGKIAIEKKDLDEAILLLEKASNSKDAEVRMEVFKTRLELYFVTDNPQKAIEEGEKFVKKYSSNSGEAYYIIGNANRSLGNKEKALEMYRRALKETKEKPSVKLIYNMAELYSEMDSMSEALSVIEEGISSDSLSLLKGKILMMQENFDEAFKTLVPLERKRDSLGTVAKYHLGEIKEYQHDTSAAFEFYKKAVSGNDFGEISLKAQAKKEIFENFSLLQILSDETKKDEKDDKLLKSNFEKKDSSYIFFRIGELYYWELRDIPEGIKWYKEVYEVFPESSYAPKAIYTLLNICLTEDSTYSLEGKELFSILREKYPKSKYAEKAREPYDPNFQDTTGTGE